MNGRAEHFTNPQSRLVALDGGPRRCRWFFYQDWLALRASSRRGRYSLDHPCGSSRCYLPTNRFADNTDPTCAEKYDQARVWEYVPPETWARWGREYLTPEEAPEQHLGWAA